MSAQPARVLIVDDHASNRDAIVRLLLQDGCEVAEACSGAEALSRAADQPDVILLDIDLPDISGFEVCRKLKAGSATADIPVLMLTGVFLAGDDHVTALESGAESYLAKPVAPTVLLAQVRAAIRERHAEQSLRANEALFRTIVEKSFEALLLLGKTGTIRYVSPPTLEMLGYSREEVVAHIAFDFIHPEDRPGIVDFFERLLTDPLPGVTLFYRVRHKDGSYRSVECRGTNLLADPSVRAVVANFRDITEQRRLEDELRQSQKMEAVGRLAGGIAHDFNNVLTVINSCTHVALMQMGAEHSAKPLVEEVKKAAERAADLTRQLLAFSRKQILQPEPLDLNEVVRKAQRLLSRLIGEDIELDVELEPAAGWVRADAGQLDQALVNLAVNARDAMPTAGRLLLRTRAPVPLEGRAGRFAALQVIDNGHGMTKDLQAHIFEPFFTTKEVGQGTGLGLSMVHGFMAQTGGHITVQSAPGAGSTFTLYLPSIEAPSRTAAAPLTGIPRGTETILLVEDEAAVRDICHAVLEDGGYRVLSAAGAEEAVAVLQQHEGPLDLLLTDVVMPGIGGPKLAEQLRLVRPGLKVLFMSGYTEDTVVRHGLQEAELALLQKPFGPDVLLRKVREVLDAPAP